MELKIGLQKYFYLSPLLREGVLSMYDRELFEKKVGESCQKGERGDGETREERRETREERREIVQICLLFIMLFKLSFSF